MANRECYGQAAARQRRDHASRVARRGAEGDRSDFTRRPADPGQAVRRNAPIRRQGSRTRRSRRSSRYGRRRARPTCSSSCSTTSASPRRARSAGRARRRRRAPGRERPEVQPLPHHGAVRPDAGCVADRAQPPLGGNGRHHRARHLGARLQLDSPQHLRAAGADAAAERLFDGAVRQVPRGAGLADEPDGPLRRLADRRRRLRVLLRLHRR